MFTLTILLILAVMVALFGCLMGPFFAIIGLFFSLLTGILVGALAGYLANRFMGTQTSFLRNVVLGVWQLCRRVSVRDVPHLRHRQLQLLRHLGRGRLCLHLDRQQAVPLSRLS